MIEHGPLENYELRDETFEILVSKVLDGVIFCDEDKTILLINTAAKQLLGLKNEQNWIGESLSKLDFKDLTQFLDEAKEHGINEINKVISSPIKKSRLLGVHTELLRDSRNSKIGWMLSLRDVTMNWQNDQMRSALSMTSHELKTPLNSMNGAIDLLLEQDLGELNPDQQRCLTVMKDDIQRLNRLTSDILDSSRFDEGVQFLDRRKEISLLFILNKVINSFRLFANSKEIKIENKIPKTIPTFKGDRDRLQQVLANLLENSIKYSLPGGNVEIHAELNNSILCFWVRDNGVGIPESELSNIFGRFKQLDNYPNVDDTNRGYGLGLSIAKEIVEAIGGKIRVESQVEIGSTFYVSIPV